jgi:hypothetical protein
VALLNDHLDELDSHRAKAYMTLPGRAGRQARLRRHRRRPQFRPGEAKRRAEQFFRIEASVGMD